MEKHGKESVASDFESNYSCGFAETTVVLSGGPHRRIGAY